MESLPKIFEKHPDLFVKRDKYTDFLEKKMYVKEQNMLILKEVSQGLKKDIDVDYSVDDLFFMQKLYLLYPDVAPENLLSLSWEHIKVLLNLLSNKKRDFYIEKCLKQNWDVCQLQKAILRDMYEKYLYVEEKYKNKDFSEDKFMKVQDDLWINE